jgi:type I restriction enzyme R subunit
VRDLRQRQTPVEAIFWEIVRDRRFCGLKFRRQHQIGLYIVDFYCHARRCVVELDGEIHDDTAHRHFDPERDAYLRTHGFRVIRIANDMLLDVPERVMEDLAIVLDLL